MNTNFFSSWKQSWKTFMWWKIYTNCHQVRILVIVTFIWTFQYFLNKVLGFEWHLLICPSVSLQARHPVHPRFTLSRETGQVSRSPVVAMVMGPGDRGSGGWKLTLLVSNRRRKVASILTMIQALTAAVVFFPTCCIGRYSRERYHFNKWVCVK